MWKPKQPNQPKPAKPAKTSQNQPKPAKTSQNSRKLKAARQISMTASQQLVESVVQVFWAIATACTTDIGDKVREWMINLYNQAYFRTAKQHRDLLLMLEQPDTIVDQLTESDVMSEEFGRWLNGDCFKKPELLPKHVKLLGHVERSSRYGGRMVGHEKFDELRDWLQRQHMPVSALYKQRQQLGMQHSDAVEYLHNCKKYVAGLMKHMLEKKSNLTNYKRDYETVLVHIAGKVAKSVAKPTWAQLEVSVHMTVASLAHQAVQQSEREDCFTSASLEFAAQLAKPAKPAEDSAHSAHSDE